MITKNTLEVQGPIFVVQESDFDSGYFFSNKTYF